MTMKLLAPDDKTRDGKSESFGEGDARISQTERARIPRLLEVPEVGQHIGLPGSSIYRLIRMRILPAVRIGRRVMVAEDDLIAFIKNGGVGLPE